MGSDQNFAHISNEEKHHSPCQISAVRIGVERGNLDHTKDESTEDRTCIGIRTLRVLILQYSQNASAQESADGKFLPHCHLQRGSPRKQSQGMLCTISADKHWKPRPKLVCEILHTGNIDGVLGHNIQW